MKRKISFIFIVSNILTNSVFAAGEEPALTQAEYINMLEKINSQLSYSWNPYIFMIGVLTALITLGAIVATIIIYIQNKNFRRTNKEVIDGLFKDQKDLMNKMKREREESSKRMAELIAQSETKLKELSTRKNTASEKLKDAELLIANMKKEYSKIQASNNVIGGIPLTLGGIPISSGGLTLASGPNTISDFIGSNKCVRCGRYLLNSDDTHCPECNKVLLSGIG